MLISWLSLDTSRCFLRAFIYRNSLWLLYITLHCWVYSQYIDHTFGLFLCLCWSFWSWEDIALRKILTWYQSWGGFSSQSHWRSWSFIPQRTRFRSGAYVEIGSVLSQSGPRHCIRNIDSVKIDYKFAYLRWRLIVRQIFFANRNPKAQFAEMVWLLSDLIIYFLDLLN